MNKKCPYVFIIHLNLPLKQLHSLRVLLYHDSLDTAAVALHHIEVGLGVLMGTVVVGTLVVGIAVVLPVVRYLYVQQPCLGVQHNQVAGQ